MPRNRYGHRRIGHREDLLVVLPFQNQGIDPCLLFRRSEGDVRGLLSSLGAVLLLLTAILVRNQSLKRRSMWRDVHLSMPLTEATLDLVEICDTRRQLR